MNKLIFFFIFPILLYAQEEKKDENKTPQGSYDNNKFKQNYDLYATPNMFRTASGAPGPAYYQQQADYKMNIILDDKNQKLYGEETITYHNNSPETLEYLWVQLDQNNHARNSKTPLTENSRIENINTPDGFVRKYLSEGHDGGFKIDFVKDANGKPMKYIINETMMRIDLEKPLKSKEKVSFSIKWWYNIINYQLYGSRSGYEHFPKDGNNIYVIAQFYPRMAVYNDVEGWQNMQFWGRGEFALNFGNYDVNITVPADHVLEGTGVLLNRNEVFTAEQVKRYALAEKTFDKPVLVVTPEEAKASEKGFSTATKTWKFKAENVRDYGFSTSRKFILDAMNVKLETKTAMAISLYPNEGNPLWEQYSTRAVAQTLKTYSKHTFDYPYPKAISVSAEDQGMEYPMICWNYGRPDEKGVTPDRIKWGMISVIIHEVGHNYFPMIVNSDERQWTWMDEGLNTFLEYLTELEFDPNFPVKRGPANLIVPYMKGDQKFLEPIMVNSEVIYQFGPNAYAKPATALNILRETIMGKELFDFAFKTYANRWKFKHPTPEDFFRTMQDASAVDLDYFWRGWFYSTDVVDLGIKDVKQYYVSETPSDDAKNQSVRRGRFGSEKGPFLYFFAENDSKLEESRKKDLNIEEVPALKDFISKNFNPEEQKSLKNPKYFYEVTFDKPGGLIMPILVNLEFEDGTFEDQKFPEQIWRKNNQTATRVFATNKKVKKITLDKKLQTADVNLENNTWPKENTATKFDQLDKK
jgi:hypothetical protein